MPRAKRPQSTYVFARAATSAREPGSKYPTSIPAGSVWHADCPLVKANPDLFSDEPSVVFPRGWEPPVEAATAAPGEHRSTGRG